MSATLTAIQLVSGPCADENMSAIEKLLAKHSPQKNELILLPENAISFSNKTTYLKIAETLGSGEYQTRLASLAKQYHCYLVCGSFPIKSDIKNKIYTTSLVFSPQGELISYYHKMHLFDALVTDNQGTYKESDTFVPGSELKLFDWDTDKGCFKVGLAICYDLRFAGLFQSLRAQGADILLLPAAFTKVTGEAHWKPLLQTRAIENQCYVLAANQGGVHEGMRETYGHSMVLSPWGEVLEQCAINEGVVSGSFCKVTLDKLRQSMPTILHNRFTSILK